MRLHEFSLPVKPYLCRIRCEGTVITTVLYGGSETEVRRMCSELFGKNALLGITSTSVQVLDDGVGYNQHKNRIDVELTGGADGLVKKMALARLNDGKVYGASKLKRVMNRTPQSPEQLRVSALQNKVNAARARGDADAATLARNDLSVEKARQAQARTTKRLTAAATRAGNDE